MRLLFDNTRTETLVWMLTAFLSMAGCGNSSNSNDADIGDSGDDTGSDADTDIDTDVDGDTDVDNDADGDTDGDSDGDSDTDSDTDGDSDRDSEAEADTDVDSDTDVDNDADGDSDGDSDADVDLDADTDSDTDTGIRETADTGADAGPDSDSEPGNETEPDTDTGAEADAAVDPDTGVDTDISPHIEWISISGGTFDMGSENGEPSELPVHAVSVPGFEMMKTEVTVSTFEHCVRAGICKEEDWSTYYENGDCNLGAAERGDHPMNCVSWKGSRVFCEWAGGRLPSEAEWEYAARSQGAAREYPWGDEAPTCERAVMKENGQGCGMGNTLPVCSKPLGNTEQGLCDMAGNLSEWVEDYWYGEYSNYDGAPTDGSAWVDETLWDDEDYKEHGVRGGSWDSSWSVGGKDGLRTTARNGFTELWGYYFFGFRCVR